MSTTISAVLVNILVMALPWVGVSIGDAALTTTVQTIIAILTGLWIWRERVKRGDVSAIGLRKGV